MAHEEAIEQTREYMASAIAGAMEVLVYAAAAKTGATRTGFVSLVKSRATNLVWHLDELLKLRLEQSREDDSNGL